MANANWTKTLENLKTAFAGEAHANKISEALQAFK